MSILHDERYTTPTGLVFDISVEHAPVPDEADYFGYTVRAREANTSLQRTYAAMIKRETCATLEEADLFVTHDPMTYLKHSILDHYRDGSHPMIWPDPAPGWVLL